MWKKPCKTLAALKAWGEIAVHMLDMTLVPASYFIAQYLKGLPDWIVEVGSRSLFRLMAAQGNRRLASAKPLWALGRKSPAATG